MRSRFFVGMACACLLIAFTGFAQSFFLGPLFETEPDMPLEYVHGAVMTAWLVIFFIQAYLVATHRTAVHRRIGVAGAVVGVGVLVVGMLLTIEIPGWLATQGLDFSVEENLQGWSRVVWGDFGNMAAFGAFFGSAMFLRHRAEIHKRLMLLASISILGPALARMYGLLGIDVINGRMFSWSGLLMLIVALVIYDLRKDKRVHIVTLIGGPLFLIDRYVFPFVFGASEFGQSVVLRLSASG
jgi:hypothetical protein